MKCAFDYCIYNNKFTCILNKVQINALGMCDECEIVSIPRPQLEKQKQKRLKAILKKPLSSL